MARHPADMPAWRVVATALAAFAVGVQLVLAGFLIGQRAWAVAQSDTAVLCAHERAGLADETGGGPAPDSHDFCPACACPESAQSLAALPPSPGIALPLPRSEVLIAQPDVTGADLHFRPPYASRAPPRSA